MSGSLDNFRLGKEDKLFLKDLARVRIIELNDADKHHFSCRKNGGRQRLDRLKDLGILVARDLKKTGSHNFRTYEFANEKIAKAFGGKMAVIGSKRSALHETLASKVYFTAGRPESFKISSDFKKEDIQRFRELTNNKAVLPDALFFDEQGSMVIVEADSGHYTKKQVLEKQAGWLGVKQIWSQPAQASAKIRGASQVFRFG